VVVLVLRVDHLLRIQDHLQVDILQVHQLREAQDIIQEMAVDLLLLHTRALQLVDLLQADQLLVVLAITQIQVLELAREDIQVRLVPRIQHLVTPLVDLQLHVALDIIQILVQQLVDTLVRLGRQLQVIQLVVTQLRVVLAIIHRHVETTVQALTTTRTDTILLAT
jgi:hypothetical protein